MIPISTYNIRKREMELAEEKLFSNLRMATPWQNSTPDKQQIFLETCRTSLVVAIIKIGKKTFPSEPINGFRKSIFEETRKKIYPKSFDIRIDNIKKKDSCLSFYKVKKVNKATWFRNKPQEKNTTLNSFLDYIHPAEEIKIWFKEPINLSFSEIKGVFLEKTAVKLFEHNLNILHILTK